MPICSFCKKNYEWPRGLTVIQNDGSLMHLCSSKCRKNLLLGREGRKVNWARVRKNQKKADESEK